MTLTWLDSAASAWERAYAPPDPAGWAAGHGVHLWSAQRDIARSVVGGKRTVVRAGHAVGKSFLAATLASWWIDTKPGGMVVTTAPSYDQVHGILWHEMRELHDRLKLPGRVLGSDEWVIGGSQVAIGRKPPDAAVGSDFDPSTFQGYHRAAGVLVILDEACGVPEWLWNAAETITTSDNSRILAIGNPDNPGTHFAKVCTPGHHGWQQHKISVFDSPNFTGEEVPDELAAALVTQLWEQDRRDEWGQDDHKYISKVLAEFPSDHPRQVISIADILACQFPDAQPPDALLPVELGVDVGGGGDDTVIRERRGVRAGREWVQKSDRPEDICLLILRCLRETGATAVKVDSIGVGAGVVGELRNMQRRGDHQAEVYGVNVGEAADDPVKYVNRRAQLWWEVGRIASQERTWDLSGMANSEVTVAQLCTPRYFEDLKGRIQIEKKDDIRARTGRSPDNADALLLAYARAANAQQAFFEALTSGRMRA